MAWLPHGEKVAKICLFVLRELTNVTDRQTDTACRHIPRLCIASRGKKTLSDVRRGYEESTTKNSHGNFFLDSSQRAEAS